MTKQQEKDTLSAFIASLPQDNYLRPIFEDIHEEIERQIDCDFAFLSYRARTDEQHQHRKEVRELIATRDALNLEIRKQTKLHDQLAGGLADLRNQAKKLAVA